MERHLVDSDVNAVTESLCWAAVEARIWIWWIGSSVGPTKGTSCASDISWELNASSNDAILVVVSCAHHVAASDCVSSTNDVKTMGEACVGFGDGWAEFELDETTVVGSKVDIDIDDLVEKWIMLDGRSKPKILVIYLAGWVCTGDDSLVVGTALIGMSLSECISTTSAPGVIHVLDFIATHNSAVVPPEGHLSAKRWVAENGCSGQWSQNVAMRLDARKSNDYEK